MTLVANSLRVSWNCSNPHDKIVVKVVSPKIPRKIQLKIATRELVVRVVVLV